MSTERNEAYRQWQCRNNRQGKVGSTMDPYTAMKSVEYNQQELARLRGSRNWVSLFRK